MIYLFGFFSGDKKPILIFHKMKRRPLSNLINQRIKRYGIFTLNDQDHPAILRPNEIRLRLFSTAYFALAAADAVIRAPTPAVIGLTAKFLAYQPT